MPDINKNWYKDAMPVAGHWLFIDLHVAEGLRLLFGIKGSHVRWEVPKDSLQNVDVLTY